MEFTKLETILSKHGLNLRAIGFISLSHYSMHPVDTFTTYLRVYDSPRTDANVTYIAKRCMQYERACLFPSLATNLVTFCMQWYFIPV